MTSLPLQTDSSTPQSLDLHFRHIAGLQINRRRPPHADAAGRTGEDQVARVQRAKLRDVAHQMIDRKNKLLRVGVLHHLAVQPQLDVELARFGDLVGRDHPRGRRARKVSKLFPIATARPACLFASRGRRRRCRKCTRRCGRGRRSRRCAARCVRSQAPTRLRNRPFGLPAAAAPYPRAARAPRGTC